MPRKTTRCDGCGCRVRWNPETREGPIVFFEDRAPVSARRGQKRR